MRRMKLDQRESIFILVFVACFMHVASPAVLGKNISTRELTGNPCPRTEPRPSNGRVLGYVWVSASGKERLCCLCNLNETMVDPCLEDDFASTVCALTDTESTVKDPETESTETTATTTSITRTTPSTVLSTHTVPTSIASPSFEVILTTTTTGETITPVVDGVHQITHDGGNGAWHENFWWMIVLAVICGIGLLLYYRKWKKRNTTPTRGCHKATPSIKLKTAQDGSITGTSGYSSSATIHDDVNRNSRNIDTENMQLNANNQQGSSDPLLTRTIIRSTLLSPLAIVKKYFQQMKEDPVDHIEECDVLKFARCIGHLPESKIRELQKRGLPPIDLMIEVLGLIGEKMDESSGSDDDVISDVITYFKSNNLLTISEGLENFVKSENVFSNNLPRVRHH